MKDFDMKAFVKAQLEKPGNAAMTKSLADEMTKVVIAHELRTRKHVFKEAIGTKGKAGYVEADIADVCQSLTVKIFFKDIVLQPHRDFEDMVCEAVAEHVAEEISGYWENANQDEVEETTTNP